MRSVEGLPRPQCLSPAGAAACSGCGDPPPAPRVRRDTHTLLPCGRGALADTRITPRSRSFPVEGDGGGGGGAMGRALTLCVCVVGIYASYLTQGVLQERISTARYAPDDARFANVVFLNLAQAAGCALVAGIALLVRPSLRGEGSSSVVDFWRPSVSNTLGPALGTVALKNISYPAQVLAKSGKMVPVMLMGALVGGARYTTAQYCQTLLVGGGVAAFAFFKGSSKALQKLQAANAPLGYALCAANLLLDGYTNAYQDAIKRRHPQTTSVQMMFGTNLWCALYYAVYAFVLSDVGGEAQRFLAAHPEAARDVALFALCGAVGQNFIFLTIAQFGSLVCVTVTTTRKFANILLSVVVNRNPLQPAQWAAVMAVFAGLSWNIYEKQKRGVGARQKKE